MADRKAFQKAQQRGMTPLDVARMERELNKVYNESREEAVCVTLALMFNVLISEHWEKTAKKKIPGVMDLFLKLYITYLQGSVTLDDLVEYIHECSGVYVQTKNIVLKGDGKWEKVERLGDVFADKRKKTKEDYQKEHQTMTEMYQFCADHLQATIKRKTTSEEKKNEAELQLKKFEAFYNAYTKQLEDECFVDTGAETLKE